VRSREQPLGRVGVADLGVGMRGADRAQRSCLSASAGGAQACFCDADRAARVGPLRLSCASPCDQVGVIGLTRQAQRALQQRGAPARVARVLAQPARVDCPARLHAHERRAQVTGCDLAMLGDQAQLAVGGAEDVVRAVRGIVRADDRQQTLRVAG
jgi:hypothetical protein